MIRCYHGRVLGFPSCKIMYINNIFVGDKAINLLAVGRAYFMCMCIYQKVLSVLDKLK